ncbi:MAG: hypothetical protein M3P96_06400 [Actinomycetota bacterium]|nr:hypothetical protein [Actinomycetota bacterium]
MSFDDLPENWAERPLDEPGLVADVLDLVVSEADRRAGALAVLICDDQGRLLQPCVVSPLPPAPSEGEREHAVRMFAGAVGPGGSLLLAIARRDGLSLTDDDHGWAAAARRACGAEVRLLGVHVVTAGGSREVIPKQAA